jgi:hypothetical protein
MRGRRGARGVQRRWAAAKWGRFLVQIQKITRTNPSSGRLITSFRCSSCPETAKRRLQHNLKQDRAGSAAPGSWPENQCLANIIEKDLR